LIVMLRSSSFLKRTVWTPEMALTTVDLPCATWPMVPGKVDGNGADASAVDARWCGRVSYAF